MNNMPSTPKEAKTQNSIHYFTGKPCNRGHISVRFASTAQCKACQGEHTREYYSDDPEKYRALSREDHRRHRDRNVARMATYREENPDIMKAASKSWRDRNTEKIKQSIKKWKTENKDRLRGYDASRIISEVQATPDWLTSSERKLIREVYASAKIISEETGEKHHVDHIVPLVSKYVCGLHVPWNLRVIPALENLRKGASFDLSNTHASI